MDRMPSTGPPPSRYSTAPFGAHDHRRIVPRVAVSQLARRRIQHAEEKGDERLLGQFRHVISVQPR